MTSTLRRKTPLRQKTPLARTGIQAKRRNPDDGFDPQVRAVVERRSGGRCEFPGCASKAAHLHHRQPRRGGDHTADNALHVCQPHHLYIHAHPAESYENGWLVRVNAAG